MRIISLVQSSRRSYDSLHGNVALDLIVGNFLARFDQLHVPVAQEYSLFRERWTPFSAGSGEPVGFLEPPGHFKRTT